MKYLIISTFALILGLVGFLNPVRNIFHTVFSPLQIGIRETTRDIKHGIKFFTNLRDIRNENLALLKESEELRAKILELRVAEDENKILREQLNLDWTDYFDKELVIANVLGNPLDSTGGSIVINRGADHGIKVANNVIKENYLVGIVRKVFNKRSIVELIISPSFSATAVDIDVPGKTEGLVTGQHGMSIEMSRILPSEEIRVGDTIVTSGKDGVFEPDLIVGKVDEIIEGSAEPLKTARLDTIIDISNLDRIFVIVD